MCYCFILQSLCLVPVPEVNVELEDIYLIPKSAVLVMSKSVWNGGDHSCMQMTCKPRPIIPLVSSAHMRSYAWEVGPVSLFGSPWSLWAAIRERWGSDFSCCWQFPPNKIFKCMSNLAQAVPLLRFGGFFFSLSLSNCLLSYIWE